MFRNVLASAPRRLFSSTPSRTDAFADLARITSSGASGSTSSPSSSTATSTFAPQAAQTNTAARGYAVGSMPAKGDPVIELFTNILMVHGKKAEAQRHMANILGMVQRATNSPPVPLVHKAIFLSSPQVYHMSVKRSNKTIMAPRALSERQRTHQGIKYLLKAAERGRKGGVMRDDRIAREVLAVLEGTSDVFKKVEEIHKMAMLNRSNMYAHAQRN